MKTCYFCKNHKSSEPNCEATLIDGDFSLEYYCTRPHGHPGNHVACGDVFLSEEDEIIGCQFTSDHKIREWAQEKPQKPDYTVTATDTTIVNEPLGVPQFGEDIRRTLEL